jgi:hypothetical protein
MEVTMKGSALLVSDRSGSLVRVPAVRKIDVVRDGEKGILFITVDGDLFLPAHGIVYYDRYEDAQAAAMNIKDDLAVGENPSVLIALAQAGPPPFPWRLLMVISILIAAVVCVKMILANAS